MVSTRGQASLPGAHDTDATSTKASKAATTTMTTAGGEGRKKAAAATTTTKKKAKSIDVVVPSPPPPPPSSSSHSRRQRGPSSVATAAVPEEQARSPKASSRAKSAPSPQRKQGQSRQPSKSMSTKKSAADVADADVDSSSSDEEENDDGLACLAQGMLDALCGLQGGSKLQEASSDDEGEGERDDGDVAAGAAGADGLLHPTTRNNDGGTAASSSSDSSDSDSESDSESEDKPRTTTTAKPIFWAPRSLLLPAPATSTRAVSLLARETLSSATPERAAARRALEKAKSSASRDWFDLPNQTLTPELKTDLRLLKLRGALDPTRHYKSADSTKLPGRFHVGTVVEPATEFYSSRLAKAERGQSLADELLRDKTLSAQRKRRFGALQEAAQARGWKGGGGGGKGAKVRKTTMPRLKKHRVRPKH